MTLLERIEAPTQSQGIDDTMIATFRDVPGAVGLALAHGPAGTRGLLVLDERRTDFHESELEAMSRLLTIRRLYPLEAIDVLCLSTRDADSFDASSRMSVHAFA